MNSKNYEKLSGILETIACEYQKAAKEALESSPGEFHRLSSLADKASELAADLWEVYWRKNEQELLNEFEIQDGTL